MLRAAMAVALALLSLAGCGRHGGAMDGGALDGGPGFCYGSGETECHTFYPLFHHFCCEPGYLCCYQPAAPGWINGFCSEEPCPVWCGPTTTCPASAACRVTPSDSHADSGGCLKTYPGYRDVCVERGCAGDQRCGTYCCGAGTRCSDGGDCCLLDQSDAGAEDGGPADAGGEDAPLD